MLSVIGSQQRMAHGGIRRVKQFLSVELMRATLGLSLGCPTSNRWPVRALRVGLAVSPIGRRGGLTARYRTEPVVSRKLRYCLAVTRIPRPKILSDLVEAQQVALPHIKAGNDTQARMLALLKELQNEHSGLSSPQRAARRREVAELQERLAREDQATQRAMGDLKAKHPRWIS